MYKRFHAGHFILGFGALTLVFIFILLYAFMQKDPSMVTKDYYEQELKYDRMQEAMQQVIPFDSLFKIRLVAESIELIIPKQINDALTSCTVQFYCPANEIYDKLYQVKPTFSNMYSLNKPSSQLAYILKIYLHAGSKDYYKEMKI
jgi:FixH